MNVQRSLHPQYHDLGALKQGTESPTAPRALQHKWLPTAPGVCSGCVCVCVCVFTAVCVHIGWVKCRAPYLAVCHITFTIGYPILTFYITELNFFSLNMTISRNYNYFGDMTLYLEMLFYVTQCDFFNHSLYTIVILSQKCLCLAV